MQYYLVLYDYEKDIIDVIYTHSNLIFLITQMKDHIKKLNYNKIIQQDDLKNQYEGNYLIHENRKSTLYSIESYGYLLKTYTIKKIKSYRIIEKKGKNNALDAIKRFNKTTLKKRKSNIKKKFSNSFNLFDELSHNKLFKHRRDIINIPSDNESGYNSDQDIIQSDF